MPAQLICNPEISYANTAVPFSTDLDLVNSVLTPTPGNNQKFCYIVTGEGSDNPDQKDLSHWVLGICSEITAEQIVQNTISVIVDGEPQTVVFGDNVEFVNPDPETGCPGLKFEFNVSKLGGVMNVCFELTQVYPIGPNPVCVKGGQSTVSGQSVCGPVCEETQLCESVTFQPATICVPVTVTPVVVPGPTRTTCCGDPVITPRATSCPEGARSCSFTVSQRVCVEVPIGFGARTKTGVPTVACEDASGNFCTNCD